VSTDSVRQFWDLYKYTTNPIGFINPDGLADYEHSSLLDVKGMDVVTDPNFMQDQVTGQTYCNHGALTLVDDDAISGMTANQMYDALSNDKIATKLTQSEAMMYANEGVTVVSAWKNTGGGSGHVAVLAPGSDQRGRPMTYNVGQRAYHGKKSIAYAFSTSKRESANFGYFILNNDKASADARILTRGPGVHITR